MLLNILKPLAFVTLFFGALALLFSVAFGWFAFPMLLHYKAEVSPGWAFLLGEVGYLLVFGVFYAVVSENEKAIPKVRPTLVRVK